MYAALWRVAARSPVGAGAAVPRAARRGRRGGLLPVGVPGDQPAPAVHGQHRRCGAAPRQGTMGGMTRVLVVDNYDSFVFTIVGYLEQLGAECEVVRNDAVSPADAADFDGVLVSPGPGTPEEAGVSMAMIEACAERAQPMLGVCLGPPGARGRHGRDRRPGARAAARQDLAGAPRRHRGARAGAPDPFTATRYHSLTIDPADPARRRSSPTAAPSRGSSWRSGTPRSRCTACSSTPSRCSPTAATACSRPGSSCAGCRMPSSARPGLSPLVHDAAGVARMVAAG